METLNLSSNSNVKLQIAISTEAIVATNISLNDGIIKKSKQYKFSAELGPGNDLENKELSIVTSCFLSSENTDQVLNNTQALYTIEYGNKTHQIEVKKQKITKTFFIVYGTLKFTKA